jgi:TatD DNase family protein
MRIVDTHCHLTFEDFQEDLGTVLARARRAGVERIVTIGLDVADSRKALALARRVEEGAYGAPEDVPRVFVGAGVHPSESAKWNEATRDELRELAADPRVVALGETGLDYYRDYQPREVQRRAFLGTLELAREIDLPVILHVRQAYDDVLDVLADFYGTGAPDDARRGILHCFSGGAAGAERGADLGFFFGFGGPLTYKKSPADSVRAAPRSRLLLETDAPFLAPQPFRGKRNESSHLPLMAEAMGAMIGLTGEEAARLTRRNAFRMFGWEDAE